MRGFLAIAAGIGLCACDMCSNRVPEPASAATPAKGDAVAPTPTGGQARLAKPVILGRTPHDPSAFTQGLLFADGVFLESTGLYGKSSLRRADPASGRVLSAVGLQPSFFAEGLARLHGELFQLTWREHVCLVYDEATLQRRRDLPYDGEGWGLTSDGDRLLVMSDGTAVLRFMEPASFRQVRAVTVRDGARELSQLNELEWVEGEILANVWQTPMVARIDPVSGQVRGYLDLSDLPEAQHEDPDDVLNGIAYDSASKRLFVTGKRWNSVFEIRPSPQ